MTAVERALKLVPELDVETVETSCCGMAGAWRRGRTGRVGEAANCCGLPISGASSVEILERHDADEAGIEADRKGHDR